MNAILYYLVCHPGASLNSDSVSKCNRLIGVVVADRSREVQQLVNQYHLVDLGKCEALEVRACRLCDRRAVRQYASELNRCAVARHRTSCQVPT